jgi:hypothetical protein
VLQNDFLLENAPVQKFVPEIASLKPAASVQIQKLSYQEDYSINRYSMHSYLRNDFSDTRDNFSNKNASKIDKDAILIGVVVALLSPHVPFAHVLYGTVVVLLVVAAVNYLESGGAAYSNKMMTGYGDVFWSWRKVRILG